MLNTGVDEMWAPDVTVSQVSSCFLRASACVRECVLGVFVCGVSGSQVLLGIRSLLVNPNPDDPLVHEVAEVYRTVSACMCVCVCVCMYVCVWEGAHSLAGPRQVRCLRARVDTEVPRYHGRFGRFRKAEGVRASVSGSVHMRISVLDDC